MGVIFGVSLFFLFQKYHMTDSYYPEMYTCRLRCAVEANPDPDLYLDLDLDPDYLNSDSDKDCGPDPDPAPDSVVSSLCLFEEYLICDSYFPQIYTCRLRCGLMAHPVPNSNPIMIEKCCLQSKVISIHSILLCSLIFNANYVTYPSCNGGS